MTKSCSLTSHGDIMSSIICLEKISSFNAWTLIFFFFIVDSLDFSSSFWIAKADDLNKFFEQQIFIQQEKKELIILILHK